MSDGTTLDATTIPGGDIIDTEDPGGGAPKIPRSKIVIGARDVDGGDVSGTNPMPIAGAVTVSGTPNVDVANFPATQPVSAVALPLPSGAAQDSTLTSGSQKAQTVDGSGNVLGTPSHPTRVDPTGTTTQPVSVAALPLPTGAAQDATLTARLGTLGQKTSAASAPVVIASDQSAIPISGTVTLTGGTDGLALDATLIGGTAKFQQSDGTNTLGTPTHPTRTDPTGTTTQPVSAAALPLPTGAAQDSTLTSGTQKSQIVDAAGHVLPAGDTPARSISIEQTDGTNVLGTSAHPTRIDPTGTTTQPISAASLPLPTGAALDATITARLGTVGQKTMAGSAPIVVASDQGAIPISAASLPLPTGAAADATLTARLGTVGQKTMAGSTPVVIASDQGAIPISAASLPLPAGAALDATFTGGTAKTQIVDGSGHNLPGGDVAARGIFVKATDGTNTSAVKAASTAPVATDPAMVVAISPNGPATVVGSAAAGSAVAGNPVLVAGKDPSGNAQDLSLATDKSLIMSLGNAQQTPLSNATVTSSGSATYTGLGHKEFNLTVNIKNAPTGTLPTLTFQIQELDPGDQSTTIGAAVVGTALIAAGTQTLKLPDTTTGCVKVTWTIGGTGSPSFTGVYATASIKPTEDTIEQFAPVAEDNTNGVYAVVLKPLAVSTYAWTVAFTTALATNLVVKASAGVLRKLFLRVDSTASTASYYIQLFNATTLPADGTGTGSMLVTPRKVQITTLTDQNVELDFTDSGFAFSTGLVVVLSTTEFTKTIASAFLTVTALYK